MPYLFVLLVLKCWSGKLKHFTSIYKPVMCSLVIQAYLRIYCLRFPAFPALSPYGKNLGCGKEISTSCCLSGEILLEWTAPTSDSLSLGRAAGACQLTVKLKPLWKVCFTLGSCPTWLIFAATKSTCNWCQIVAHKPKRGHRQVVYAKWKRGQALR